MLLPPPHPKQATVGQSGGLTNQNINSPIYWAVSVLKFPRKAKDRRLLRILQIPFYPCSSYEFIKFLTIGPLSSVNPPPHIIPVKCPITPITYVDDPGLIIPCRSQSTHAEEDCQHCWVSTCDRMLIYH